MLVMQTIIKPKDSSRSQKFVSYPYQALEESVTNSLYHRDYREWEPVVITVEPQGITIQNVGGPDRSISAADISRCEILVSKRYRNRRLGEYLKELDLTEGRSTGIPTIQNVLENNGSPRATVVTDDERTFFRITIPCHEAAGNIIADIAHKDGTLKASKRGVLKTGLQSGLESGLKSGLQSGLQTALESALESALQTAPKSALKIIEQISNNPRATMTDLAKLTGYSRRWVAQTIKRLQEQNIIKRIGSDKSGYWEIIGK
jgi:ATP-dependent DNA helicase RecG